MKKNKKTFDAVAMMRKIRDEMSREIEEMSFEEEKRYLGERDHVEAEDWIRHSPHEA